MTSMTHGVEEALRMAPLILTAIKLDCLFAVEQLQENARPQTQSLIPLQHSTRREVLRTLEDFTSP
jgi:hypothetical protein